MVGACDNAQQDGWTGFYSDPLDVQIDGRSRPHPVIADYGLDRSSLWGSRTPDDNAPSWCAFPGPNPSSWGARAYVLRPGSECFAPRKRWGDDHSYWVTPTHRLARDFAQWRLMGRTIRFTVDLHHVGCGAVLTLYLSALPAVNERYELNPQNTKDESVNNPGCASQMYYADANPELTGCESFGFEFDLFEGNAVSMHTSMHGCVSGLSVRGSSVKSGFAGPETASLGAGGWFGAVDRSHFPDPNMKYVHNQICDSDGTGTGISGTGVLPFANGSYGWGAQNTINTQHPFEVAVRFDDGLAGTASPHWSYTVTLSQAGRSLSQAVRKADSVREVGLFARAGTYHVVFSDSMYDGHEWIVVCRSGI